MVCVFARQTSEPLTSLVKQLDEKIGENGKLKSFVVLLTPRDDKTSADTLRELAKSAGIKNVPLTLLQDPVGPPDYEIAKDADITVLMWSGTRVKVNYAFKGKLTDDQVKTVVADVSKILNK